MRGFFFTTTPAHQIGLNISVISQNPSHTNLSTGQLPPTSDFKEAAPLQVLFPSLLPPAAQMVCRLPGTRCSCCSSFFLFFIVFSLSSGRKPSSSRVVEPQTTSDIESSQGLANLVLKYFGGHCSIYKC